MLHLSVLGNLGADAERREMNGRVFYTFRVAHSEKRGDSVVTMWVSCATSRDITPILPFLKKGTRVYVHGRASVRVFSSAKTHQYEAGLDLNVERIEFCNSTITREQVTKFLSENKEIANEIYNELPF